MRSDKIDLTREKILIVDDVPANLDVLRQTLEALSYDLLFASSGAVAVKIAARANPDLILLDVMMPGIDGFETCRRLKAEKTTTDIPVIFITARDEPKSVIEGFRVGGLDYITKPFQHDEVCARVNTHLTMKRLRDGLKEANRQIQAKNAELEVRNRFIRQTFGRYLTDEVVASLLESPEGLKVGGEKRKVTILMADLRGSAPLAESLPPEEVVSLLNIYLETMTDVILKYEGTINEFIGDAILVIFGAPTWKVDDAERAIACAVEMQLAMETVNEKNRNNGLSPVEMGIGVNTGEVVVGNIGSLKRAKYGIVGSHVNLTQRIESYTVGGQILISDTTHKETIPLVKINRQMQVEPKGVKEPITIYEVEGISGKYSCFLPQRTDKLFPLLEAIPVHYTVLEEKFANRTVFKGHLVKLSARAAEVRAENPVPLLSNLRMRMVDADGENLPGDVYGKVVDQPPAHPTHFSLRFTTLPKEVITFLHNLLATCSESEKEGES